MKHCVFFFLIVVGCMFMSAVPAQKPFTNCAAAFVGDKMVVNEYSPKGTCQLTTTATGDLSVQTVDFSPESTKALDKIDFNVAIRDKATGTLIMYSGETFRQVPVQQVLAKCKKGDHIVLLTLDNRYALPHNEIVIQ
ncbi:MAG: hypothetical protein LH609_17910 [Rudanella sp.]|nr:hypothetical protein [Rudanella sp.]